MKIRKMRSDGKGIQGTYANARHHAEACLPLIDAIKPLVATCGFIEWVQGHNVHTFETADHRKFDMIPYYDSEAREYKGIELRIRKSRSTAERLVVITSVKEVPGFMQMLAMLAQPLPANDRSWLAENKQA